MTSVASSDSQYCNRSLPETSALLPTLTNDETPRPSCPACAIRAKPNAPDCELIAMLPAVGSTGAKVPSIRISEAVLTRPIQFGPTRRIPDARQTASSSACQEAPSAPTSANPAEI